jgi:hypothetical protein
LNIEGCSSSIAEKKSCMAWFASDLLGTDLADVEAEAGIAGTGGTVTDCSEKKSAIISYNGNFEHT